MGRMRIEIALIVGIVFFCCWCIYIIIKMNSSVSLSSHSAASSGQRDAEPGYLVHHQAPHSGQHAHLHHTQLHTNASPLTQMLSPINDSHYLMARQQQQQQQQQQQLPAGYQVGHQQQAPVKQQLSASNQQPQRQQYSSLQTSLWPTAQTEAAQTSQARLPVSNSGLLDYIGGASTWRDYSSVTAQQLHPVPTAGGQQNRWLPQSVLGPSAGQVASNHTANRYGQQYAPLGGGQSAPLSWRPISGGSRHNYRQNVPVNEQDLDPDPDGGEHEASETQADQEADSQSASPANNDDEQDEDPSNVNREVEEQDGRRSFSEDEDESNERDKNGNLIITHRKHLINGKPVPDGARGANRRRNRKQVDFDKVVGEIEGDDQNDYDDNVAPGSSSSSSSPSQQEQQQQQQQQADESRPRKTIQSVNMSPKKIATNNKQARSTEQSKRNRIDDADEGKIVQVRSKRKKVISNRKPKKGERELHEHRLHESLTAQQWDDDASSSPGSGGTNKTGAFSGQNATGSTREPQQLASGGVRRGEQSVVGTPNEAQEDNGNGEAADEEEEEEEGAEKVEEDDDATGPQQVETELKEMDMLVDPERFMSSDEDTRRRRRKRRRRKKRQVQAGGEDKLDANFALLSPANELSAGDSILDFKPMGAVHNRADSKEVLNEAGELPVEMLGDHRNSAKAEDGKTGLDIVDKGLDESQRAIGNGRSDFGGNHSAESPIRASESRGALKSVGLHSGEINIGKSGVIVENSDDNKGYNRTVETANNNSGPDLGKSGRGNNNDGDDNHDELLLSFRSQLPRNSSSSDGPSKVEKNASVDAPFDMPSNEQTEVALAEDDKTEAIEQRQNVATSGVSDEQPERHNGGSAEQEVVSGEEDMNYEVLARPPYSMSPAQQQQQQQQQHLQPPGPQMINNVTAQYLDALQAPYSRPGRDLGQPPHLLVGSGDSVPAPTPPDDEQTPQMQSVQPYPSAYHNREASIYYSPPAGGQLAAPNNQPPVYHQSDEPPFDGYHGVGPPVDPNQPPPPPPSEDAAYLANGMSNGPVGQTLTDVNSNHLASASKVMKKKKKTKKKKKKKKFNKSMMSDAKLEKAKAISMKKKSKYKKGGMKKRKKDSKNKAYKIDKEFNGDKKGKKGKKGQGEKGANKGNLYYKDKGYKKRGFKKAYKKLEEGDHKTYFDEFRDKDHNKKWKKFNDKHHYSQKKNWTGKDRKKFKNYQSNLMKDKKEKEGAWREKAASKYKKVHKYRGDSSRVSKKKKVKKGSQKKKSKDYF